MRGYLDWAESFNDALQHVAHLYLLQKTAALCY